MKLNALINVLRDARVTPGPASDPDITGIFYRSKEVAPGGVFVALPGHVADGHHFVEDAVNRGAVAVVVQQPVNAVHAAVIRVPDTRQVLGPLAAAFYGHPSERLTLIGITGTNGKTTSAYLLEHILRKANIFSGMIGTIDYHLGDDIVESGLTTPEASDLQRLLALMADAGATHVIMEVSSHGVVLDRINGCRFALGIFTNLTQDHLDFHSDMAAYRDAKKLFFTRYLQAASGKAAVINCDDACGRMFSNELAGVRLVTAGTDASHAVQAASVRYDETGISATLRLFGEEIAVHSPLIGRFNLENILSAAGAAIALGIAPEAIRAGIETFVSVPGRLEPVPNDASRHVFVDFCHTPDALENVLATLKTIIPGRLICVFGCGGDRDKGKRPLMGEIAARLADLAIVTSDNPRTEPPDGIIEDILAGVRRTGSPVLAPEQIDAGFDSKIAVVEPDRARAIRLAIGLLRAGDGLLIAGKGHETYQIIGRNKIAFDDRIEAQKALAEHGYGKR